MLRYLNPDVDLGGSDPTIGFNYLGRLGAAAQVDGDGWRICDRGMGAIASAAEPGAAGRDRGMGVSLTGAATAVAMPLMHTVDINAGTLDTDAGPQLHAAWTWAPSALDRAQITKLSQLWFDALAGICAHVRGGGGGLTPSDIAPARLSQQQIDELQLHHRIADVLPLTPMQQGLLFHASAGQGDDDVYAVQLDLTVTGALDVTGCARQCTRWSPGIPTWRPGSVRSSRSRSRSSRPIRWRVGGMFYSLKIKWHLRIKVT